MQCTMRRLLPALSLCALLAGCASGVTTVTPTYFLIAERFPNVRDSYLLPLTKPDDIARARFIMSNIDGFGQIAVARIARGSSDGFTDNRDLLHGGRRWSWHVSEFLGFGDATIELIDGTPSQVEADLDYWLGPSMGRIGFWNYTVSREVRPAELWPSR